MGDVSTSESTSRSSTVEPPGLRFRRLGKASSGESAELNVLESEVEDEGRDVDVDFSGLPPSPTPSETQKEEGGKGGHPELAFGGFLAFLWAELSRGYALENDEARYAEKRRKVYAFVKIPRELERFLIYGFLQCTDAFLYFFTFLPLRFVMAVGKAGLWLAGGRGPRPSELCDLLKVTVLFAGVWLMGWVDTSFMYHLIRGQAVIKLYIFYNMLEVADKLFSSFGQDILDALFWTATEPRREGSSGGGRGGAVFWTAVHLLTAIAYVFLHTMLVLLQATTLSVAFNSHNKALLTIMMSNNFVELKGSVFKKFAKSNLFQMACSDVRERFHYVILLSIVIVRNMTAVNWKVEHFWEMCPDLAMVIGGEFVVDWLKHAFITKFNEIPYEVYRDFTTTIAYDVAKSRQREAFSDHSDQVARRMGFIPLPLSVLLIRILHQSLNVWSGAGLALLGLSYVALVSLKVLNSLVLLGKAAAYIADYEEMQKAAALLEKLRSRKRARSLPSSPRLSLIDFNDIMGHGGHTHRGLTIADVLASGPALVAARRKSSEAEAAKLPRSKSVAQLQPFRRKLEKERARQQSGDKLLEEAQEDSRQDSRQDLVRDLAREQREGLGEPLAVALDDPAAASSASPAKEQGDEDAFPTNPSGASLHSNAAPGTSTPKRKKLESECESLRDVNRYTLVNDERIEL